TVHGYTPTAAEALVPLLKNEGYNVVCTSSKKQKMMRLVKMLVTIYNNRKNSVALLAAYSTNAFYFAVACSLLCRSLHIPYITCLHGGNLPQRIKNSPRLCAQLFMNSFMNVAVSDYLKHHLQKKNWHCIVIKNPIEIKEYPFKQRTECSPTLFWLRSFHNIYNPQLALQILQQLLLIYNNAKLIMIGPDKDGSFETCRQLSAKLNLHQHIEFTGLLQKQDWIRLSANYDFFINTSNFDNAPVSVAEAMALGMLVVSTNVGGMKYMISHTENGMLVPQGDAAGFAQVIDSLVHDAALAKKLSSHARITAEQYDSNTIKNEWNKLLQHF
ncbi:MAG: glycosyltransferase family 4 protein, partial [Parafilimonas sp.]